METRWLIKSAEERDIPWFRLLPSTRIIQLGQGCHQKRAGETTTCLTGLIAARLCVDKAIIHELLHNLGLPVPRQSLTDSIKEAQSAARHIGYPVAVKPNDYRHGKGVTVEVKNAVEVARAFQLASKYRPQVLVEEYIEGDAYRLVVINGQFVSATRRARARVVGDGLHTIEELVEIENSNPLRSRYWSMRQPLFPIEFDPQSDKLLSDLGFQRSSTPESGEVVPIQRTAAIQKGGIPEDVTALIHADTKRMAERTAKIVGLDIAGIDYVSADITRSCEELGSICEVNATISMVGHAPENYRAIVEMLFPASTASRIPIVTVSGNGDTTETARQIALLLEHATQLRIGLAGRNGVRVGDAQLSVSDASSPVGTRQVLMDPDVELAVIELSSPDLRSQGMICDACDVAVIVGSDPDDSHLVPARVARRAIVIDAAHQRSLARARKRKDAKVFLIDRQAGTTFTQLTHEHQSSTNVALELPNAECLQDSQLLAVITAVALGVGPEQILVASKTL